LCTEIACAAQYAVTGRTALEKLRGRQMPGGNQEFGKQKYSIGIPIYKFQKKGLHACIAMLLDAMKQSGGRLKKLAKHMEHHEVAEIRKADEAELTASKLRLAVTGLLDQYAVLLANDSIDIELQKKLDEREPPDAAGNLGKEFFSKREKKEIMEQMHELTKAMLIKEIHALFFEAYDVLAHSLIIPGTVKEREQGCEEDVPEFGACGQCRRELLRYAPEHVCYSGPKESWQCSACSGDFGVDDGMFCCDRFASCSWSACSTCQSLIHYVPPCATETAAANASDDLTIADAVASVGAATVAVASAAGTVAGAAVTAVGTAAGTAIEVAAAVTAGGANSSRAGNEVDKPSPAGMVNGTSSTATFDAQQSEPSAKDRGRFKGRMTKDEGSSASDGIDASSELEQMRMQMGAADDTMATASEARDEDDV